MTFHTKNQPSNSTVAGPFQFLWTAPVEPVTVRNDIERFDYMPISCGHLGVTFTEIGKDSEGLNGRGNGPFVVTYFQMQDRAHLPLSVENLHRRFADLPLADEAIANFVTEFGFLGRHVIRCKDPLENDELLMGESIDTWKAEILTLNRLIKVFDALRSKEGARQFRLDSLIQYNNGFSPAFKDTSPNEIYLRKLTRIPSIFLSQGKSLSLDECARRLLQYAINAELEVGSRASITLNEKDPVYIIPKDLLGALYVMLATEIKGASRPFFFCLGCGKPLYRNTLRQKHCNEACKAMAYRQRRLQTANQEEGQSHE